VASLFERLQDQVGAAVEFDRRRDARTRGTRFFRQRPAEPQRMGPVGRTAFDHWTLSKTPLENAEMPWRELPATVKSAPKCLDIITHSRGGLVARAMMQLQLNGAPVPANVEKSIDHVVFVGTPNFGTALADETNWSRAADLLLNLIHLDSLGLYGKLSGLLARLALGHVGAELENRIPGLQAQNPSARKRGQFLGDLLAAAVPADVSVSAIASNYEPRRDEPHLKFIAQSAGDAAVDAFFDGFNDLVVNTTNVWLDSVLSIGSERARLVKRENLLVISPSESGLVSDAAQKASLYGVHHTNLFTIEETRGFLVRQLRQ
jgi:hypothetical protein